ncbi:MAG: flavodoxin family protein [Bacteroidales bacterium]|nr:flavodoxin family protein [Bacteroidales bacterium]
MRVVLFNGSPREKGNTATLLTRMSDVFHESGAKVDYVQLGGQPIQGCTACMECRSNKDERCVLEDDPINEYIQMMKKADAIVIGSPVYFSQMTPETKALIDRCGYVIGGNGKFLSRKIGAAVTVARRAGMMPAFHSINDFFFINDMVVPGSRYWNVGVAREPGEVENDPEGLSIVSRLAENILWLHECIQS